MQSASARRASPAWNEKILGLDAGGMTVRDIAAQLLPISQNTALFSLLGAF